MYNRNGLLMYKNFRIFPDYCQIFFWFPYRVWTIAKILTDVKPEECLITKF